MTHAFVPFSGREPHPAAEQLTATVHDYWAPDVQAIQQIEPVPRILRTVCLLTGMGFSCVGRVTPERWLCCAAYDEVGFGLKPGTELDLHSTLCKDICLTGQPVVIDEVAFDVNFANHPVPKLFRFQSNISFPIILRDGSIWGTLCAVDEKPARVSRPEIVATFRLFADLIASQLELQSAANDQGKAEGRAKLHDPVSVATDENRQVPLRSLIAETKLALPLVSKLRIRQAS